MAIRNNNNNITGYGVGSAQIQLAPVPEAWSRAPTSADIGFQVGYQAIYNGTVYSFTGATNGSAVWAILLNGSAGTSTLVNGTKTVSNSSVTANSKIFLTRDGLNASTAIADLHVSSITAGSFVVTSTRHNTLATETGDQSTFNYLIIN